MSDLSTLLLGFVFPPSGSSSSGGYYDTDYYGDPYYDADYYEQPTSPPTAYATLLAALLARLNSQLSSDFPGGFWVDVAKRGATLPYAVLHEVGETASNTATDDTRMEIGQIQVTIYGESKATIRDLGNTLMQTVEDCSLTFTEGTLLYIRQDNRYSQEDPERSPSGIPVYQEIRTFEYWYSRTVGA